MHPSAFIVDPRANGFPAHIKPSLGMTDDGLVLGSDSILVRMSKGDDGAPGLALDLDRDRFATLMAVVGGRPIGTNALQHVKAADAFWRRGDKALANLRLIFADLPRLATLTDAYRLTLATHLLDEGMTPGALMKELGLRLAVGALKYAPDQARVPAGHGRESGRFTYNGSATDSLDSRIIVAGGGPPEDEKTFQERQRTGLATPEEEAAHGHPMTVMPAGAPIAPLPLPPGVGLGPYAGRSIPAGPTPRPSPSQQKQINEIGKETGCHTCGTKNPGVDSGNWVGDHQDPNGLVSPGTPQRYFRSALDAVERKVDCYDNT